MGGWQTKDAFPESFLAVGHHNGEILGNHAFVWDSFYSRIMEELLKLRGDQDEVAAAVVVERPDAKNVACAEERAVASVPNCECEIAQNAYWGVFPPLEIGLQDQFC